MFVLLAVSARPQGGAAAFAKGEGIVEAERQTMLDRRNPDACATMRDGIDVDKAKNWLVSGLSEKTWHSGLIGRRDVIGEHSRVFEGS